MGVSFDMAGLQRMKEAVEGVVSAEFRVEMSQVLAASALHLVDNGFRAGVDPYGEQWAPLSYRKGQPLLDTGRMRASAHGVRTDSDGFTIEIGTNYAVYHQKGASVRKPRRGRPSRGRVGRIPQRMMVPDKDKGMGPVWSHTFQRDAVSLLRRRFGRGD